MENKKMEKLNRCSGVLLHITSLPNDIGLGCFSRSCYEFVDFLRDGNFKCWQTLPFTDCLYDNSPYSAISSFAINPYFLDIREFLSEDEIGSFSFDKSNDIVHEHEKFDNAINLIYEKCRSKFDTTLFEKNNNLIIY